MIAKKLKIGKEGLLYCAACFTLFIHTFIRHKDRQYKIETGTDRIKTRLKKRTIPHKKLNYVSLSCVFLFQWYFWYFVLTDLAKCSHVAAASFWIPMVT